MTVKSSLTPEYLYIDFLVKPLPIFCVTTTFINDHWLKYHFAGFITGKLSDFCGLFYFPLFLCGLVIIAHRYLLRRPPWHFLPKTLLSLNLFLSGVIFTLVKAYSVATMLYLEFLSILGIRAQVTKDHSDLLALSVLFFSYRFGQKYIKPATEP